MDDLSLDMDWRECGTGKCRAGAGQDGPDGCPERKNFERNPGIGSGNVR
jgi:hypothetical protein